MRVILGGERGDKRREDKRIGETESEITLCFRTSVYSLLYIR